MLSQLLGRLGQAILAAWGIASLVFVLSRLALSSPEQLLFNESGDLSGPTAGTSSRAGQLAARQSLRHRLGLDEPVFYLTRPGPTPAGWRWHGSHNQYHHWLTGLLRGQLGTSYRNGQPVTALLRAALAYTLPLAGLALGLVLGGAGALALALASSARAAASGWRGAVRLLLVGLQALPMFALALGLLFCFANPDFLDILPAYSLPTPEAGFEWRRVGAHLVLPLLALVLASLPELTLTLEAALRHEAQTDYATTARAKGLPPLQLLSRHLLPNALLPSLSALADLLPTLLAGTVVVETLYAVPGTGRLLAEAAAAHDYPVVVGGVLLSLPATALATLLGALAGGAAGFWGNRELRLPLAGWLLGVAGGWWALVLPGRPAVVAGLLALALVTGVGAARYRLRWLASAAWPVPLDGLLRLALTLLGAVPRLILVIGLAAGPPLTTGQLLGLLVAVAWPEPARLVRAQMLRVRELPFVEAARASGLASGQVWWRHALPHACLPLWTTAPLSLAGLVSLESTLAFLGVGQPPDVPSWGRLLGTLRQLPGAWWLVAGPGAALLVTLLALRRLAQRPGDQ